MKTGFIKPLILIVVIVGLLVISGLAYFELNQYFDYKNQKSEAEKLIQEQEQEAEKLQTDKEKEEQKSEIDELKKEVEGLKNSQNEPTQQQNPPTQNSSISSSELTPYISGVVELLCDNGVSGSGSLYPGGFVLTNFHVIDGQTWCSVIKTEANNIGMENYYIKNSDAKIWNNETDVAVIKIRYISTSCVDEAGNPVTCPEITSIENLNYRIFDLPLCQIEIPLGSSVAIIGYPAFGGNQSNFDGIRVDQKTRIITTGIISGYDTINKGNPLWKTFPYPNYFISAKIDSGSSGGIAFAKNDKGLCILGIPTWLTVGNYETQGIIQNIHNVFYTE